jgi:two-component system response regulator FixJ
MLERTPPPTAAAPRLVHVVDDEPGVRASLADLFEVAGYRVIAHASAASLLAACSDADCRGTTCIVSDIRMPQMDGVEMLLELGGRGVRLPVVLITGHADVALAVRAMRAGAQEFLEKPFPPDRLLDAVAEALARPSEPSGHHPAAEEARRRIGTLTPREAEVLEMLTRGMSNKAMAAALELSPRTIEAHRAAMMERLGVDSLALAVRLWLAAGNR